MWLISGTQQAQFCQNFYSCNLLFVKVRAMNTFSKFLKWLPVFVLAAMASISQAQTEKVGTTMEPGTVGTESTGSTTTTTTTTISTDPPE